MRKVEALAVFNPQDRLGMAFQEALHHATGQYMTAADMRSVKRCLSTYRGLQNKSATRPEVVASLLFDHSNVSNTWYYPCDIVELRTILSGKNLSWHAPVMLFSPSAARKLMPEYPVCLVFDRSVAKEGRTLGGVLLREGNRLDLADSLKQVMIRDYLNGPQAESVERIIRQCVGHVPTYLLTGLPGSSYEKVASTGSGLMEDIADWFDLHRPVDTSIHISPDKKHVILSLGDANDNQDELGESLQSVVGDRAEVETCSECGKEDGYLDIVVYGFRRTPKGKVADSIAAKKKTGGAAMNNWYGWAKKASQKVAGITSPDAPAGFHEAVQRTLDAIASGPAETFGKEFLIGRQPQIPDEEEIRTKYESPKEAMSLKQGDRVAYRYTNVKLPGWAETKNVPMTRSLVQKPQVGTIKLIDNENFHILWDGAKEIQKVPLESEVFLIPFKE